MDQPQPLEIPRFVKLITKKPLDAEVVKQWYRCVEKHAPSGVVIGIPTINDEGRSTNVRVVHRTMEDQHAYLVPLSRDLRDAEVDVIVRAFAKEMPKLNFEVETNETKLIAHDHGEIPLDAARHAALCLAIAKQQHEQWMRERSEDGWRYGTRFDTKERTHPLMLPWEQLPDHHRKPDMTAPQALLSALNAHGYAVLPQAELDFLLDKLRP